MDWLNTNELLKFGQNKAPIFSKKISQSGEPFDYEKIMCFMLEQMGERLKNKPRRGKAKLEKSNSESVKLREEANRTFVSATDPLKLCKSLELYTKSIAFAVKGSQEMSLSYANRSAVLMKMNRPKESLEDIERALELNYPDKLKTKLHLRRAECLTKLTTESYIDCKISLNKSPPTDEMRKNLEAKLEQYPSEKGKECNINEESIIPKIVAPSDHYPCSSSASVKYSEVFGRHIVATRNIDVGEVLVIEKPYSQLHYGDKTYSHCSYCLKSLWTNIPCEYCVNAVYCSISCKLSAWHKYHKLECPIFEMLVQYEGSRDEIFSTRLFLQAFLEAGGLQQLKVRLDSLNNSSGSSHVWPLKDDWYKKCSLESVFALETHVDKISDEELTDKIMLALRIVFLFASYTEVFGETHSREKFSDAEILMMLAQNPYVKFVGGALVRLLLLYTINLFRITEDNCGMPVMRGVSIMPFISLFNHSCFVNTHFQYKRDHIVLYAALPVQEGEQLFVTYGEHWCLNEKQFRQEILYEKFFFTCSCIACKNDWPKFSNIKSYEQKAKSSSLRRPMRAAWTRFVSLYSSKVVKRDLANKDEVLDELCKLLKIIYEGVHLPCSNLFFLMEGIRDIYYATGNISKVQHNYRSVDLSSLF